MMKNEDGSWRMEYGVRRPMSFTILNLPFSILA